MTAHLHPVLQLTERAQFLTSAPTLVLLARAMEYRVSPGLTV